MKQIFVILNFLLLLVLLINYSSCNNNGEGCDCTKSRIVIIYENIDFYSQFSYCPEGMPCNTFLESSKWYVSQSVSNIKRNFIYDVFENDVPAFLGVHGCYILESESIFDITRNSLCIDSDYKPADFSILCYDRFVVSPPPCGKIKFVNRQKLLCFCD